MDKLVICTVIVLVLFIVLRGLYELAENPWRTRIYQLNSRLCALECKSDLEQAKIICRCGEDE